MRLRVARKVLLLELFAGKVLRGTTSWRARLRFYRLMDLRKRMRRRGLLCD